MIKLTIGLAAIFLCNGCSNTKTEERKLTPQDSAFIKIGIDSVLITNVELCYGVDTVLIIGDEIEWEQPHIMKIKDLKSIQ